MPKKNKYKSNRALMIIGTKHFAGTFEAAMEDQNRFDKSQKRFEKKRTKKLKKGEH